MEVSIIIVNYNTIKLLQNCLHSILEKTSGLQYEIIVVDNSSTDGSPEMVKSNFPEVILVENKENMGFGRANNEGARHARGEYLLLLNSDTVLLNNAVWMMYTYSISHPKTGICGGNLYSAAQRPATSFARVMPGLFTEIDSLLGGLFLRLRYGRNLYFNFTGKPMEINGFLSGADMMIRKDLFHSLTGFDPVFFMYYEETELTFRVRKLGRNIVSIPDAKLIHLEGASENIKENAALRSFKSKFLYYKQIGEQWKIVLIHLSYRLLAWQRILIFSILGNTRRKNYWVNMRTWESIVYNSL